MKTFSFLVAVAFGGVCLGGEPASTPFQAKEPIYEGKPLSQWIALVEDEDEHVRDAAVSAIGKIGPAAIPALRELLGDKHQRAWDSAARAMANMGSAAIPAITELFSDKDETVRYYATEALGKIGAAAVPTATKLLKHTNKDVRGYAALALGNIGPDAKTAIPALADLLKDKEASVRFFTAGALGKMRSNAKIAVPALIELLKDKDAGVRWATAGALGNIGPAAKTAIPALTEVLNDKEHNARGAAADALGKMGSEAKIAIPVLTESLKDKDKLVGKAAAEALDKITPILPPAPEGKTWNLVWHDEFDGTKLDSTKWEVMPDAPRKGGWWMRKAVSLDGKGHLVISTLKEGDRYIDGCVRTKGKFEHSFGYYVARVQLQKQPGHWSAFWIMGDGVGKVGSGGRDGTEIDIYEKPWLDDRVQHTLHWDGYGKHHKSQGHVAKVPGVMDGWHTFGLWWKPDEYIFYVDGKETWRTKTAICQVPEYIKLSDEIGNWGGDIKNAKLPDAFFVDYVRVYDVVEESATIATAKVQVKLFGVALKTYQVDVGEYPSTAQGLQALRIPLLGLSQIKWAGPYLDKDIPLDPWGKPYHYRCPGVPNPDTFDVWSVGPDGKQIGNWK